MAKSNYLSRILFIAGVCLCGCAGSDNLVVSCVLPVAREGESVKLKGESIVREIISCLLPVVCENQVHLKFCSPIDEQRQNRVFSGVKSPFLTTDNRQQKTHEHVTRNPQLERESVKLKGESIERVVISCLLPVVCENQVHSKFCRLKADQRAKKQEPGQAGFPSEQTSKNPQQERVFPGVKYPFLTTDNRQQITENRQQTTHEHVTRNPQLERESVKLKGESIERVVISCLLPVVCENQVHLKFCSPIDEQRQNRVFSGIKSPFQTTDNRQQITPNGFQQLATKRTYDSEIGTKEWGLNKGKRVEEYLEYVNLKKGQPWCAAFICWVYGQAGVDNPRSGWTPDLFKGKNVIWRRTESLKLKAKSSKNIVAGYQLPVVKKGIVALESNLPKNRHSLPEFSMEKIGHPRPTTGDIFGIFFPEKNRIAHAGFIDQWADTWLITVEGNTNVSGSREGDGVYRKRRLIRSVYRVARYIGEL